MPGCSYTPLLATWSISPYIMCNQILNMGYNFCLQLYSHTIRQGEHSVVEFCAGVVYLWRYWESWRLLLSLLLLTVLIRVLNTAPSLCPTAVTDIWNVSPGWPPVFTVYSSLLQTGRLFPHVHSYVKWVKGNFQCCVAIITIIGAGLTCQILHQNKKCPWPGQWVCS